MPWGQGSRGRRIWPAPESGIWKTVKGRSPRPRGGRAAMGATVAGSRIQNVPRPERQYRYSSQVR